MNYIVLIFGALTSLAGIAIAVRPEPIFRFLGEYSESFSAYVLAALIRIILGVALISCSAQSKFPITLLVIGWLSLAAAVVLLFISRQRFKAIIAWAVNIAPVYHHLGGVIAMVLGGFLFYAVV